MSLESMKAKKRESYFSRLADTNAQSPIRLCACGCGQFTRHNNEFRKAHSNGVQITPEYRAKISAANLLRVYPKGRKDSAETRAKKARSHLGKKASFETIQKVRAFHIGRKRPQSTCDLLSKVMVKRAQDGKLSGYHNIKRSVFKSKFGRDIVCLSSYERRACELIEQDKTVVDYEGNTAIIPYQDDSGKARRYLVDFKVVHADGTVNYVEIKPGFALDKPGVLLKAEKGARWAKDNGVGYEIWTEKTLFPNGIPSGYYRNRNNLVGPYPARLAA